MSNLNYEKISLHRRQTRWNQIEKKYATNGGKTMLNSPNIRHLIEIDFIGKINCRHLIGDSDTKRCLNPILVMNLRHEMIPEKLSKKISIHWKKVALCTVHNKEVENHYLNKQLQDCREQLTNAYKRFRKPTNRLQCTLNENSVIKKRLDLRKQYIFNCYTKFINDGNKLHQEANETIKINLILDNTYALNLRWHGEAIPVKQPHFPRNKNKRVLPIDELNVFHEIINSINANINSTEQYDKCLITTECCGKDFFAHCHQVLSDKNISKICPSKVPAPTSILSFPNLLRIQINKIKSNDPLLLKQSECFLCLNHISNEICEIVPSENANTNENFVKHTDNIVSNRSEQLWSTEFDGEHDENSLANNNQEEIMKTLVKIGARELYPLLCCVCFDSEVRINKFRKENSLYSVNSNGLHSIISEFTEEVLTELQIGGRTATVANNNKYNHRNTRVLQKHGFEVGTNLILSGCFIAYSRSANILFISGKTAYSARNVENKPYIDHVETNDEINEEVENPNRISYNEKMQTIAQLFQTGPRSNHNTLRKYFLIWVHYINIEKIERECADGTIDRVKRINIFLNKVRKQKELLQTSVSNLNCIIKEGNLAKHGNFPNGIKPSKIYQNKIKIQHNIIELQKMKLERQERIILKLKLGKLSEETNTARQQLKDDLKNILCSGNLKVKAKAKCLQLIGNLRDAKDEKIESLKGKSLLLPKFLQRMQQRALEHSIKHEQAKQRRLRIQAEREAQKLAQEELKRLEDEESRRNRIAALRQSRQQEKLEKIRKAKDGQLAIDNFNKAALFYRYLLLKRVGIEGFKRLLNRKRNIEIQCKQLSHSICQKHYIHIWVTFYYISNKRRNQKANDFYKRMVERLYLRKWLNYIDEEKCKMNLAIDWHECKFSEHVFQKWLSYTRHMSIIEDIRTKQAILHYEWHTKWKILDRWQHLSQILQIKRKTEERRQKWRMKIWEHLPDYKPNRNELDHI